MKWIEVIQLRSAEINRNLLESKLNRLIGDADRGSNKQVIMAYSRVLIDTDFSIHLCHDSNEAKHDGSRLGVRIVNALKEFGLVNHSVWVEIHGRR